MCYRKDRRDIRVAIAVAVFALLASDCGVVDADVLSFDSLQHGEIVNNQYPGVTISAENPNRPFDLAVAFDSTATGTADEDLEAPWLAGNLAPDTVLGNVLILAEHAEDVNPADGRVDSPDDEGSMPAGSFFFEFDSPIISFGFDLIDSDNPSEFGDGYVALYRDGMNLLQVGFPEFIDPFSPYYDSTLAFTNNSANRIQPLSILDSFDRVVIHMGGSGAIDNIRTVPAPFSQATAVPEPAGLLLWLAIAAMGAMCGFRGLPRR